METLNDAAELRQGDVVIGEDGFTVYRELLLEDPVIGVGGDVEVLVRDLDHGWIERGIYWRGYELTVERG